MLEYEDFYDKIGKRYSITDGELVEDNSGNIVVSNTFKYYSIYIDTFSRRATLICDKDGFLGREYKLRTRDCAILLNDWLTKNTSVNFTKALNQVTSKDYRYAVSEGLYELFKYYSESFEEITIPDLEYGDVVIMKLGSSLSHTGIYYGDGKILHHAPGKLSSIDDLSNFQILHCFRPKGKV